VGQTGGAYLYGMMLHSVASDNEVVDKLVAQWQENAKQQQQ